MPTRCKDVGRGRPPAGIVDGDALTGPAAPMSPHSVIADRGLLGDLETLALRPIPIAIGIGIGMGRSTGSAWDQPE
ncbi:hypothetical protein J2X68_006854 [Streptomyces sp. 3330]|nr:hypothetical protein [Streptomyces sp. 3330]